ETVPYQAYVILRASLEAFRAQTAVSVPPQVPRNFHPRAAVALVIAHDAFFFLVSPANGGIGNPHSEGSHQGVKTDKAAHGAHIAAENAAPVDEAENDG